MIARIAVADHERKLLLKCAEDGVCPLCGKPTIEKVGSGRVEDGVFCSLDCVAKWRGAELVRKYQKLGRRE